MILGRWQELPVAAYLRLSREGPGFAIPLLGDPANPNHWIVQEVDELSGLVAGFRALESDAATAISFPGGPMSRLGGPLIHVFLTDNDVVQAGSLDQLEPVLRDFVARFPEHLGIRLQIAELIGSVDERRVARNSLRQAISESTGAAAAYAFYERSALRTALWAHLIANATNEQAARRILASRKWVDVNVGPGSEITLDLSVLDPSDYSRTSTTALIRELKDEFDHVVPPPALRLGLSPDTRQAADEAGPDDLPNQLVPMHLAAADAAIQKIRDATRQEERVSILLDSIFENRAIGARVLKLYRSDRAKYANTALRDLEIALQARMQPSTAPGDASVSGADLELLRIVERPFNRGMPGNRAMLFLFMAKHLAKYPEVNKLLRTKLRNSSSIFLLSYRGQIEDYLDTAA